MEVGVRLRRSSSRRWAPDVLNDLSRHDQNRARWGQRLDAGLFREKEAIDRAAVPGCWSSSSPKWKLDAVIGQKPPSNA